MSVSLFDRIAIIGIGLIGSSIARGLRQKNLVREIAIHDRSAEAMADAKTLGLGQHYCASAGEAVANADVVFVAVPIGAYADLAPVIAPNLKRGAILTDVGSVKQAVIRDLGASLPEGVHFIPGHPIAGTEHSGPKSGFAELFHGRWCVLTPPPGTDEAAVERLKQLWTQLGSQVEIMAPGHHDQVLAITSHLPHLIAYTIVDTATFLEDETKREVVKFSASGFRDFTRIAASDPIMWRDIFLNNREAVLEMLGRFTEDLTALQRAIRWGEGEKLQEVFTRTRAIRRGIIDAKQA
jgi:cyclohexadieny/prephenate dehydrogenase